jgi:hypothetical protein
MFPERKAASPSRRRVLKAPKRPRYAANDPDRRGGIFFTGQGLTKPGFFKAVVSKLKLWNSLT